MLYRTRVHRTSHFLQGTRNTQPCIAGDPVGERQRGGAAGGQPGGGQEAHRGPRPQSDGGQL